MHTASITIAAVFGFAVLMAVPLGWIFRVKLRPGRFSHLDGMRAIAALMVVCSHYLAHSALIMGEPANGRLIEAFGAVGVQIFFCITGFLFTRKALAGPIDIGALIASRVRRIVPLYIVAMSAAIAVAIYIAQSGHHPAPVVPLDIFRAYSFGFFVSSPPSVAGMSMAGQAGQMWTLAWEWRFYAMVPLVAVLLTRRSWIAIAGALALVSAFADQFDGVFMPWVFFLPGMACAIVERRVQLRTPVQIVLTVMGVAAYAVALLGDMPLNGVEQTAICAVGFAALLFGHRAPLSIKPLRLIGEVSYSVYMLHLIIASAFSAYIHDDARWMLYQTPEEKLPLAFACLAGLFVLSFASYALIERPFMARVGKEQPVPAVAPAVT